MGNNPSISSIMIKINRGVEPKDFQFTRNSQLNILRGLAGAPLSKQIVGYAACGEHLWRAQHYKCCYCETKVPKSYNDVEHYRPKAEADRKPGSHDAHGYWWLAFNWENLLFACPGCNRSGKNSRFPLAAGSVALKAEESPPGNEKPLLIDPSTTNPVEHIQYVRSALGNRYWWARPRNGSQIGNETISVCDLNRNELLELRSDYICNSVTPRVDVLTKYINLGDKASCKNEFLAAVRLLEPTNPYVGLAYDVLTQLVPNNKLIDACNCSWPVVQSIGR